jgi:hypothetical protein
MSKVLSTTSEGLHVNRLVMTSGSPKEKKKYSQVLLHISAWVLYVSFIYIANYMGNPNIKLSIIPCTILPYFLCEFVCSKSL